VIDSWIGASNALARFEDWTIVPVPLHAARRRSRGFDQAVEIARMFAKASGGVLSESLTRQWYTAPRAQIKRIDRNDTELHGVFQTKGLVAPNILLCDDVFTTGATLEAAATALKSAGAEHIWAFTVARS
jgi:predicted amidophosphoribosyltransferase